MVPCLAAKFVAFGKPPSPGVHRAGDCPVGGAIPTNHGDPEGDRLDCYLGWIFTRSPSSALLPTFLGRVPLLK